MKPKFKVVEPRKGDIWRTNIGERWLITGIARMTSGGEWQVDGSCLNPHTGRRKEDILFFNEYHFESTHGPTWILEHNLLNEFQSQLEEIINE